MAEQVNPSCYDCRFFDRNRIENWSGCTWARKTLAPQEIYLPLQGTYYRTKQPEYYAMDMRKHDILDMRIVSGSIAPELALESGYCGPEARCWQPSRWYRIKQKIRALFSLSDSSTR